MRSGRVVSGVRSAVMVVSRVRSAVMVVPGVRVGRRAEGGGCEPASMVVRPGVFGIWLRASVPDGGGGGTRGGERGRGGGVGGVRASGVERGKVSR